MKKKALVLFSGGLDSRVVAKIMEKEGFEVELCFVKLPFGGGCCNNLSCSINFSQTSGYKLNILDATKGSLFEEYIKLVREPKYGVGAGINPCKDCKIFIFMEGKKLMEEIGADVLVTGEVLGQRPMSQMKKALLFDEEKADLVGKILRPLSAKLLPETVYEKEGLVNRKNLYKLEGRQRNVQMKLAEEFGIKYPSPGGGCLLCEKGYTKKLKYLFSYRKKIRFEEILLLKGTRMFRKNGLLFVGKNKEMNFFMEELAKKIGFNFFKNPHVAGPTVVYEKEADENFALELWENYRGKDLNQRKKLEEFKIG